MKRYPLNVHNLCKTKSIIVRIELNWHSNRCQDRQSASSSIHSRQSLRSDGRSDARQYTNQSETVRPKFGRLAILHNIPSSIVNPCQPAPPSDRPNIRYHIHPPGSTYLLFGRTINSSAHEITEWLRKSRKNSIRQNV